MDPLLLLSGFVSRVLSACDLPVVLLSVELCRSFFVHRPFPIMPCPPRFVRRALSVIVLCPSVCHRALSIALSALLFLLCFVCFAFRRCLFACCCALSSYFVVLFLLCFVHCLVLSVVIMVHWYLGVDALSSYILLVCCCCRRFWSVFRSSTRTSKMTSNSAQGVRVGLRR